MWSSHSSRRLDRRQINELGWANVAAEMGQVKLAEAGGTLRGIGVYRAKSRHRAHGCYEKLDTII